MAATSKKPRMQTERRTKSMTNCLGRVLRPPERAKSEPTSSKISPGRLRTDLRRCGAPPSRPWGTLGTLREALGMPRGSLRTLPGRSREVLGRSQNAPGTSVEQCRSPWAHFWTNSTLNALAERPAERIFVNVGMSRGSSDVRSVPFLPRFCRCRTICAPQAPRTAKPRKNIPFELEHQRLGRPARLPNGW